MLNRFHRLLLSSCLFFSLLGLSSHTNSQPRSWEIESLVQGPTLHSESLKGQLSLVQFWASWCHSCAATVFDVFDITKENDELHYITVSIDEDKGAARSYLKKHPLAAKISGSSYIDSNKLMSQTFDIQTVPTLLLIDANGKVVLRHEGHLNSTDKVNFVRTLEGLST